MTQLIKETRQWRSKLGSPCLFILVWIGLIVHLPSAAADITVSGNRLVKDGHIWVPNGFTLVGLVAPDKALQPYYRAAKERQGIALLSQARSLGASVLRFQVSQPGLDQQSSIYDPNYLAEIISSVKQARSAGFAVIVSMQWEPPAGLPGQPMMPSANTERAWLKLAPAFAHDNDVMLELLNEPSMWETNPKAWPMWQSGMQKVINEVRSLGAQNTLMVDGIHGSHLLNGAPPLVDSLNKLVYAVHPYFDASNQNRRDWDRDWGQFSEQHPVIISEWNALSNLSCMPNMPSITRDFMKYIRERHTGLILWALDLPSTLFNATGQPIGFSNFKCGVPGSGAAAMSIAYFHSN